MKLSTRGKYGLKAMVDLAINYGQPPLSVNSLAASQEISEAYLERIIASLKKGGLVRATRGAAGGYELSRTPESINVGEILRTLEGSTNVSDCVGVLPDSRCANACQCSARPLWLKLQHKIDDVLNSTTLRDMADDYIGQIEHFKEINNRETTNANKHGKAGLE